MTREHDAFERLAGAVMLGEATPEQVAALDAHAASCERCRSDVDDARSVIPALERSRDDETWRPSLDDAVAARIRAARTRRAAFTVGALGWAVAASIVFNVAFASGFAGHVASAFRATGEPQSHFIATRLEMAPSARRVILKRHVARTVAIESLAFPGSRR